MKYKKYEYNGEQYMMVTDETKLSEQFGCYDMLDEAGQEAFIETVFNCKLDTLGLEPVLH